MQVHIGKNTIEDVLLDGGFGVNIITKQLRLKLGLPKPKLAPYNLRIIYQTTTKPMGFIKHLYICSWHSLYNYIIVLQNSVVFFKHSM